MVGAPVQVGQIGAPVRGFSATGLDVGIETINRTLLVSSNVPTGNQNLRLNYFTARKSLLSTQSRVVGGGTAAAAAPTLVRWGLYSIAANGDGTLIAAIANDVTLFSVALTTYTRPWLAPVNIVSGQLLAFGLLVVTAVAAPTVDGVMISGPGESLLSPRINGNIGGQADLPANFAAAAPSVSGSWVYGVMLP